MDISRSSVAGTYESSDVYIMIEPNLNGREIEIQSSVIKQYGKQIRKVVEDVLDMYNVKNIKVFLNDQGALDCTIRARIETALYRSAEEKVNPWELYYEE